MGGAIGTTSLTHERQICNATYELLLADGLKLEMFCPVCSLFKVRCLVQNHKREYNMLEDDQIFCQISSHHAGQFNNLSTELKIEACLNAFRQSVAKVENNSLVVFLYDGEFVVEKDGHYVYSCVPNCAEIRTVHLMFELCDRNLSRFIEFLDENMQDIPPIFGND